MRNTFFIFALFMMLVFMPLGVAWANIFTVDNVAVDVTAGSAAEARTQAFEQAQGKAFGVLADRMLDENDRERFQIPETRIVSTMIQDFEVTNEKLSAIRYVGTYRFRFDEDKVKRFFSGRGLSFVDVSSAPILILPFFQKPDGSSILWSSQNPWISAWQSMDYQADSVVPLVVPIGDLEDVSDIQDKDVFDYSPRKMERLLSRYGAGEAALVIADPDTELDGLGANDTAKGVLNVHLYRTDQGGPEYTRNLEIAALNGERASDLYARAAREVQKLLRRNWKEKKQSYADRVLTLNVRADFSSLQEWAGINRKLDAVSGLKNYDVRALSPQKADLTLAYQGSVERLRLALDQQDLAFQAPEGEYTPGYGYAGAGAVYVISLKSSLRTPLNTRQNVVPYSERQGTGQGGSIEREVLDGASPYQQEF